MKPTLVPDRLEMQKRLDSGKTQREIAEEFGVSRSAIGMAMARYNLKGKRTRGRYMDTMPWTVAEEHRHHWDARMLRLEGRRREGGALSDEELRWLQSWKDDLHERNCVIMYDARTREGFHSVPRREGDDDLLRRPEEG